MKKMVLYKYKKPLEKIDNRSNGNNTKYHWLKDERFKKHGIYYIVDNDMNIYVGSTITCFRVRYNGHMSKDNICESKEIVDHKHIYGVLFDMTDIEDEELIRIIEQEYIDYFRNNDDFKNTYNKLKYKTIKIDENRFDDAIELLLENGIIVYK